MQTISDLSVELHPGWSAPSLSLDSDLERDAGLDSLGRIELMLRLQQRFGVELSDDIAINARTPSDLLDAIDEAPGADSATPVAVREAPAPQQEAPSGAGPPEQAETLVDVLDHWAAAAPERTHLILDELDETEGRLTCGALRDGAAEVAGGLRAAGLEAGDTVAIMLPTGTEFFFAFHGILRAGGVPIPLYPPVRIEQLEDHCRRLAAILQNAHTRFFIASERTRAAGRILQGLVSELETIATVPDLRRSGEIGQVVPRGADDLALLQYTSGTTGTPKGVMLSHRNLLTNIRTMGATVEVSSDDVFASWLPLYHDMGLIGAALATLHFGVPVVLLSPLQFMARPQRWLWAIHRHRATLSAGPNFAYDLCAGRIDDESLEGLDLSSWRMAFNGAEMVSARAAERFCERFAAWGFDPATMMPVYGLAESSVGLVFPPVGRGLVIDRVDHRVFRDSRRAEPAADDDPEALRFVGCGRVLPDHEIRIVDEDGTVLPDRHEGRLEFRGPSCTAGYYRNEEATRALFHDGWLDSGDLAYLDHGEVYLTGRVKELIIRAGRNIYPQEIEEDVSDIPGIRKHNVAVFASRPERGGPERVIVAAETREEDRQRLDELQEAVGEAAARALGGRPDDVVLLSPRTIPKTSSGKIRRTACQELYESGRLTRKSRVSLQLLRLGLSSLGPWLWRMANGVRRGAFVARAWLVTAALGLPVTILLFVLPGRRARAALLHGGARSALALAGIPFTRHGADVDTGGPARVVVANHGSYLDSLILLATLSGPVFFVAKRELGDNWFLRQLFRRVGVEFVDRRDHQRGLEDLERIRERARAGETVVAFAEGILADSDGLRGFRVGPFMVAVQAGLPVVPVAIRGARSLLRGFSFLPRRAAIEVTVGDPLRPDGEDWNAALRLRDRCREFVLEHCGEPDLAGTAEGVAGNL